MNANVFASKYYRYEILSPKHFAIMFMFALYACIEECDHDLFDSLLYVRSPKSKYLFTQIYYHFISKRSTKRNTNLIRMNM